jgi:hypothetical protein
VARAATVAMQRATHSANIAEEGVFYVLRTYPLLGNGIINTHFFITCGTCFALGHAEELQEGTEREYITETGNWENTMEYNGVRE